MAMLCFDKSNEQDTAEGVIAFLEERKPILKGLCIADLLNDEHIESLSVVLRQNLSMHNHIERLQLSRNSLTASSCHSLAHVIQTLSSLQELDLGENKLGEFNDNHYLSSIPRRDSTGSVSSQNSATTSATHNSKKRASLTGDGLVKLVEAISLESSRISTLKLHHNKLGPKAAAALATLIRRNTSIRQLYLGNNALGTKTIKSLELPLQHNTTLITLDLSYNNISDRGASFLANVLKSDDCHWQELNLTYNKIGPSGANSISRALRTNSSRSCLKKLDLTLNRIGPEGAASLGAVLKFSHTLQELLLTSNNIGTEGVLRMLKGLDEAEEGTTNLHRLDLSWNSLTDEAAIQLANILRGNSALRHLQLASNAIGTDGVIALAQALNYDVGLRELDLLGNQAEDASVDALEQVLRRPSSAKLALKWAKNNFSAAGQRRLLDAIAYRNNLAIWLGQRLRQIERLRVVSLDLEEFGNSVGDEELVALAAHLSQYQPQVKVVRITGQLVTGHGGVTALARQVIAPNAVHLECLYLHWMPNVRDAGAAALAQALLTNTTLRVLSLVSCAITSEGAKMLANVLRRNSHVRIVSLQGNVIGDQGAREVLSAVLDKPKPSVTSLNLSHNQITDNGLLLPTTIAIIELQDLFLGHNRITDAGALDLAKACIDSKCSLRWLDLSTNRLTWKGIQTLKLFLPPRSQFFCDNQVQATNTTTISNSNGSK